MAGEVLGLLEVGGERGGGEGGVEVGEGAEERGGVEGCVEGLGSGYGGLLVRGCVWLGFGGGGGGGVRTVCRGGCPGASARRERAVGGWVVGWVAGGLLVGGEGEGDRWLWGCRMACRMALEVWIERV